MVEILETMVTGSVRKTPTNMLLTGKHILENIDRNPSGAEFFAYRFMKRMRGHYDTVTGIEPETKLHFNVVYSGARK